jgi:hypothetical protein
METHVFKSLSQPGLYGFTLISSGQNLPDPCGPWQKVKTMAVDAVDSPLVAAQPNTIIASIEATGFCLTVG